METEAKKATAAKDDAATQVLAVLRAVGAKKQLRGKMKEMKEAAVEAKAEAARHAAELEAARRDIREDLPLAKRGRSKRDQSPPKKSRPRSPEGTPQKPRPKAQGRSARRPPISKERLAGVIKELAAKGRVPWGLPS